MRQRQHRSIRRATATVLAAALLPLAGMATANAKQEGPDRQMPAPAVDAQSKQFMNEHLRRAKEGLPEQANDTHCDKVATKANLRNLKAQGHGQANCIVPKAPPAHVTKGLIEELGVGSDIPVADFPTPMGDGSFQVNGIAPADPNTPVSTSCSLATGIGLFTQNRTRACLVYGFIHYVVRTSDGARIGEGHHIVLAWQDLNPRNRAWDIHYAVQMYEALGAADFGLNMYMWAGCNGGCEVVTSTPPDGWVVLPPKQTWKGQARLMSIQAEVDRGHQAIGMYTYSRVAGAQNLALGIAGPFMEVRCDSISYLISNSGTGCVYGAFSGSLKLRLSDHTVTEAAQFYRDAQGYLVNHAGLRGWQPLSRATPYERDANRAVSGPVCRNLPKASGQQCDEYPFAATRQGAAFGPRPSYWDVRAVNGTHNQNVGVLLSQMYSWERFFYGDTFYVDIVP